MPNLSFALGKLLQGIRMVTPRLKESFQGINVGSARTINFHFLTLTTQIASR